VKKRERGKRGCEVRNRVLRERKQVVWSSEVCGSETVSPSSISSSSVEDTYSIRIDYPYHPNRGIWSW